MILFSSTLSGHFKSIATLSDMFIKAICCFKFIQRIETLNLKLFLFSKNSKALINNVLKMILASEYLKKNPC